MSLEWSRTLSKKIFEDLNQKIVLLAGPRQVGKTHLSKQLPFNHQTYLNYDSEKDRRTILDQSWNRDSDLVVFDEIHRKKNWKIFLKGIYDTEGVRPRILVTGSAQLDFLRKAGDSLAGRHFSFRLHPFSIKEILSLGITQNVDQAFEALIQLGGFPEPYLSGSTEFSNRWRKSHIDRILREDLITIDAIRNLSGLELLVQLLSERVGSTISYLSLARDLEVSPHTVKHWIELLEKMYVVFKVSPYSKNLARSRLQSPKIYFYDTGRVNGDSGTVFENLVACHLLKDCQFLEDTQGLSRRLHYVRDKEKREVDFCIVSGTGQKQFVEFLIETKESDDNLAPSLKYFSERLNPKHSVQLVHHLKRDLNIKNIRIHQAAHWLASQLAT